MITRHLIPSTLCAILASAASVPSLAAEPTEGTATFKVTTAAAGQNFDPKHVLAIWVTDASNRFVKTLKKMAVRREQYLYTWNSVSGGNVVDAVTGATITNHSAHTVTWDCQDVAGKVVPDGEYRIRVEFTAAHEQGPLTAATYIRFTKGPAAATVTPANLANFKSMSLEFKPVLPPVITFLRGDANRSGIMDISDAVFALEYLFLGTAAPACLSAADANDDAAVDLADPVAILHALYLGSTTLPPPGAACGSDPTADSLGCKASGC